MNLRNDPQDLTRQDLADTRQDLAVTRYAIGQPVPRTEDPTLVRGEGRFTDDVSLPGQAYLVMVRSRHAHGVIRGIDRFQGHTDYEGGFVQARWTRSTSESKETVLQFSFDRTDIDYPFAYGSLNNATVDWQKRAPVAEQHELYWGAGYQQYWDTIPSRFFGAFNPVSSVYRVGDVVVRDEWQIVPSKLMASGGIRLDYNSYGHLEYQPSFRLLYTPNPKESIWFGASRAIPS